MQAGMAGAFSQALDIHNVKKRKREKKNRVTHQFGRWVPTTYRPTGWLR